MDNQRFNKEIITEAIRQVKKDYPFLDLEKDFDLFLSKVKESVKDEIRLNVMSQEFKYAVEYFLMFPDEDN